jgi:hypothetical protein
LIKTLLGMALLFIIPGVLARVPVPFDLAPLPLQQQASRAWPVVTRLNAPEGLRPCCAFGYNLRAELLGLPVPFYRLDNIVSAARLGEHHYNDQPLGALVDLSGLSSEADGIIYTRHGGFIDTAHVRDTADMTFYLFSRILPHLGEPIQFSLSEELARRDIVVRAFTAPSDPAERYALAAWIAAHVAFQVATWHEIAQWYGFQSVPGFSEGISAFSPEDLYSNLLGARLSTTLLLSGHGVSRSEYGTAMQTLLPDALAMLGAVPASQSRAAFDKVDGTWWDSRRRVPKKYLVLLRNYDTSNVRKPAQLPGETAYSMTLTLPANVHGFELDNLAELRLYPGKSMKRLPVPKRYYTAADFAKLAEYAEQEDGKALREMR